MKRTETDTETSNAVSDETTAVPDGGSPIDEDIFSRTADVEDVSSSNRASQWFDVYVYAPLAVAVKDVRTLIGGSIILGFVLTATVGVVVIEPPSQFEGPLFLQPFQRWKFPLGTGGYGQDMLAQLVHAAPAMLKMILAGALFSVIVGTLIGTLAGYKGGKVDQVLMTFSDIMLTIPGLALVIVLASVYPPTNPYVVGLILGIDNWPRLSRTIRSQVLSIREESYTEASRIIGLSQARILRKDVISNMMPYITINFANSARLIIFESVALYYLNILPFTTLNWGVMLNEAWDRINLTNTDRLYVIILPMVVIVVVSLGFMLFSQGLDRVFNVRLRARNAKTVGGEEETPGGGDGE